MTTRNQRRRLFCGLGAAALSIILWDDTTGAAAGEADNAFEKIPPNEAQEIDELSKCAVELQNKRPGQEGTLFRGVHPKSHGCVRAQFGVDENLDANHRVGLFASPGKTFEAWIRYSNAAVLPEDDDLKAADPEKPDVRSNGSRGMAVKVLDVKGEMLSEDQGRANQDFLMINTDVFAFANVRDYLRLNRIMARSEKGDTIDDFFIPLKLAGADKPLPQGGDAEFGDIFKGFDRADLARTQRTAEVIQKEIGTRTVRNPLQVQYFGAAPFGFGPERAMKFSAAPCEKREQAPFENVAAGDPSPNYLREALTETMKGEEDICFDFMIQVRDADELEEDHIENATTTWPDEATSYRRIARITIPAPQDPTAKDVVDNCEAMAFSPWHSLAAHRPLGGINRLRQQVYIEAAKNRAGQGYR